MSSKISWSKTILSMTLTGAFMVVAACGSPSIPAADAASAANPPKAKTAEPAKVAEKAAPKPAEAAPAAKAAEKPATKAADKPTAKATDKAADKKGEKQGDQLVANHNFKQWDDKTLHRWTAEPADKVAKATGKEKDPACLEMKPSGTAKCTMLRQHLSGNLAGKSVTVTLRAKSFESKVLSAKLVFETKSGPQTVVLDGSGHGGWESITKTVSVPADAKADSGTLSLVLRPTAKKSALIDYVTIKTK